jgi:hypothetical protein
MTLRVVALVIAVAGCAGGANRAVRDRLALVPAPDRPLGEHLIDADRVVAGRLLRVEHADEYEPLGSLVVGLFGAKVVVPAAYNGELRVDSTLFGKASSTLWVTFFAARGARIPQPGDTAIWVLHRRVLWRLQQCSERQSLTSTACPYDVGLALDSDDDVRPVAEWPRLRAVVATLRPSPGAPE